MPRDSWRSRQGTALLGFIPLAALLVGAVIGAAGLEAVGAPVWLGVLIGAIGGYFLSRWLLRRAFASRD